MSTLSPLEIFTAWQRWKMRLKWLQFSLKPLVCRSMIAKWRFGWLLSLLLIAVVVGGQHGTASAFLVQCIWPSAVWFHVLESAHFSLKHRHCCKWTMIPGTWIPPQLWLMIWLACDMILWHGNHVDVLFAPCFCTEDVWWKAQRLALGWLPKPHRYCSDFFLKNLWYSFGMDPHGPTWILKQQAFWPAYSA